MPINRQDAFETLQKIERTQQLSTMAYRYQRSSFHLFLWSAVWFAGYASSYMWPHRTWVWGVLVGIALIGSTWLNMHSEAGGSRTLLACQYIASVLAVFLFLTALLAILPSKSSAQMNAVFPILIAFWYVLRGVWSQAARMVLLGFALGVLTIVGYFGFQQYFSLWMAVFGSGALLLGGFWLRKV